MKTPPNGFGGKIDKLQTTQTFSYTNTRVNDKKNLVYIYTYRQKFNNSKLRYIALAADTGVSTY